MTANTGRIRAILGPTNTGKTRYAISRMLKHRTGMIGLPLRLLAREVYDKVCATRGPSSVAMITGEERIVPDNPRYWVCTVEAMPVDKMASFVAIDEIQLCGDPERGHIFTDRLLSARGLKETLFLGADTMRNAIQVLVPKAGFEGRKRFSKLSYVGAKKISRMKPRSAIVGFSVEDVYAMAELVRRQRGGAAVVMGALSPRTRNSQVALYQSGQVDFLVATDAIGMGLNLDISHVAFAGLTKFDGRRVRRLAPNELAQIAGRAGRYKSSGSFGETGKAPKIEAEAIEAIEESRFGPLKQLQWRNSDLDFGSASALIESLERPSENPLLVRSRDASDLVAMREISSLPEIRDQLKREFDVRLLWDVCQIPDYRNVSSSEHAHLLETVFSFLREGQRIPDDWLEEQVRRIDRVEGDVDALSRRIAFVRTWTYVAQRNRWVEDSVYWRERTRAVEDRLSDALHDQLTQRFVDRRTSVLIRRLKQKESMVAQVNDTGEVTVEGQHVGHLDGFRFRHDPGSTPEEARTTRAAGLRVLNPELLLRAKRLQHASNKELDITEQGGLMWGGQAVGKLVAGSDIFTPKVEAFVDDEAVPEIRQRVERRLVAFVEQMIAANCEQLLALRNDDEITGVARGLAYRLVESFGVLQRKEVAGDVKLLDQDARKALRRHGVKFGQYSIFVRHALKPASTRLRTLLWSLSMGHSVFPSPPPPGLVTVACDSSVPDGYWLLAGFYEAGERAIRIDMLERLADMLREQDSRAGFEATHDMLSIAGATLEQFAGLMQGLGYHAERGEREKPVAKQETPEAVDGGGGELLQQAGGNLSGQESSKQNADRETVVAKMETHPAIAGTANQPGAVGDEGKQESMGGKSGEVDPGQKVVYKTETADAGQDDEAKNIVFYTFTWRPKRKRQFAAKEAKQGKNREFNGNGGRPKRGKKKEFARKSNGPERSAKSSKGKHQKKFGKNRRPQERVDPDNPFSVLLSLKDRL